MSQRVLEILLGVQDRKLRRELGRAKRDVFSFARTTSHRLRSSFKDAFTGLAGVSSVAGLAAVGKNVLDVDKKLTRLGIQAGQSKAEMVGFHHQLRDLSDDTGLSAESLADAAARFVSLTGAYGQAKRGAEVFAKTSAASGASLEDVAAAAASLRNNLGIEDVAGFEKGLSILLAQGKAGAVELRELAGLLPSLAPSFTAFGKSGTEGLAELGAALQTVRQGFGSGSEAATGLNALMTTLGRNAGKFENAGVRIFDRDPATGAKRFRQLSTIIEGIGESKLMRSPTELTKAFGSSEARRAFMELHKNQAGFRQLWADSLSSNAVSDDFAAYMESNAGRIEKTWQRLQNTFARELTADRIDALVQTFEALGRVAGFVVDNIRSIAVAFAAWKLATWTRRIHSLAASLGAASSASANLGRATGALGSKGARSLAAVSLPMEQLAHSGGLLGTRGLTGVSKFAAGLSALGSVGAVGMMSYEIGTLIDKATGLSDWIAGVDDVRAPTASRYDPTGRASQLRIYADQASKSAGKQEKRLEAYRSGLMFGDEARSFDEDAAVARLRATRAEAEGFRRSAQVVEVRERLRQDGFDWDKAQAGEGKVTPEALQRIAKVAIDHTGKSAYDGELHALIRETIAGQQGQQAQARKLDEQAEKTARAMEEWAQVGQSLREFLDRRLGVEHSLADMVGRAPAP